jgi:hypothetical protein
MPSMRDLERDALRAEIESLRAMTPTERVELSFRLRRLSLQLCRAGIRLQHPEFSEEQVERELQRRILPADLFALVFPATPR